MDGRKEGGRDGQGWMDGWMDGLLIVVVYELKFIHDDNRPLKLVCFVLTNTSLDNTLGKRFFQISSYSLAYVRMIYEKTMGQPPLGKTKHTS